MRTIPRCRKCGLQIGFIPMPTRVPGKIAHIPVNYDDKTPHFKRCRLTVALREERSRKSSNAKRSAVSPRSGEKRRTPSGPGVQLDAFESR